MSDLDHLSKFKGQPGSITERQAAFLDKHGLTTNQDWSKEQASLFICTYKFCENFLDEEFGLTSPSPTAVHPVLGFIIKDPELTDFMIKWDRNADEDDEDLYVTPQYKRIIEYVESVID